MAPDHGAPAAGGRSAGGESGDLDAPLLGRYKMPDGGTVTVFAGYDRDSIDPPQPEVFRGNPFDDQDVSAFCAALS